MTNMKRGNQPKKSDKEFSFEIVEHIGVISESTKGWRKEMNLVSWNGAEAKLDIRDWSPEHDKMGKGISFNADEIMTLKELILKL